MLEATAVGLYHIWLAPTDKQTKAAQEKRGGKHVTRFTTTLAFDIGFAPESSLDKGLLCSRCGELRCHLSARHVFTSHNMGRLVTQATTEGHFWA